MVKVDLDHVYKKYDGNDKYSVTDFNLHIKDDEFIVFVGPSGCGKSTSLRLRDGSNRAFLPIRLPPWG